MNSLKMMHQELIHISIPAYNLYTSVCQFLASKLWLWNKDFRKAMVKKVNIPHNHSRWIVFSIHVLTSVAGNLRRGIRHSCQERRLSCIWEPDGDLTHTKIWYLENYLWKFKPQLKWANMFKYDPHPTRPMSAISLRSRRMCLAWPLPGWNAE